jgi:group II intron reverse transcriptase/maturase
VTNPKPYDVSKRRVLEAYRRVRANQGAAGIDGESLAMFEADLAGNLYKLWNRLSSGSYFPPPVKQVEIPKKGAGVRILGVPTVADRIAQQVVVTRIGGDLFGVFHPDSHGYQLNKSAVDAVANTRKRCWKYDWVVEFDIRRAFDELDWSLLRKAIAKHVNDPWCLLYIERWLTAPAVSPDGQPIQRTKEVPQGSVIGPVLMNLFMTYAFDEWMKRELPENPFSRYADDAVAHCQSEAEAKRLLQAIDQRLKECKLEMHPEKSGIVYCKGQPSSEGLSQDKFYVLGVRISATKGQGSRREDLDELPACDQCIGKEADQASDPRVESPATNLRQLERASQAIQHSNQELDELLRPLLQVSSAPALCSSRSEAGALAPTQVPQIGGKAHPGPRMAQESGPPATPAVCSLVRPWASHGTDNGSRVSREVPARICERLRVKSPGPTLSGSAPCQSEGRAELSVPRAVRQSVRVPCARKPPPAPAGRSCGRMSQSVDRPCNAG